MLDIINLLTLRYDPTTNNSLNKADNNIMHIDPQEVEAHRRRLQLLKQQITNNNENNIPSSKNIENILIHVINSKIEESKANHIAVALSADLDSILTFCLIRKEFPHRLL